MNPSELGEPGASATGLSMTPSLTLRVRQVMVVGALALAGCAPKQESMSAAPAEQAPVAVTVAPLKTQPIQRAVAAVGTLAAYEDITLAPKVDGRVVAVRAEVGDVAVPGTVLIELDPTDFELAEAEAKHALTAELAKLGLETLPVGDVDVEAVPAVRRAAVGLEDAERRFKIKQDLFNKQAASKDEYELADTEYRLARATKTHAVTEARSTVAAARFRQAALATAEQKLRDCRLTVPTPPGWTAWAAVTGPGFTPLRYRIAERMLAEGVMVRANPVTNAYRLVIDHVLKLRAAVPERFEPEVSVGQICEVTVDAYPGVIFPGRVARKHPTIDPLNRTFQAEIEVPNASGKLRPGGFAKAAVRTRLDPAVTVVSPAAVVTFAGVNKVFVAEGDRAKAVEVSVGTREKEWVEVTGDLPPGAKIITSGQTQLVDGSPIRVREEAIGR